MPVNDEQNQEKRLLEKLERVAQTGSSEMGFVAEELQRLYEHELSGVDLGKASPEQRARMLGILKKIGDINMMVGRLENASKFYDQVLKADPDTVMAAEIHRALGTKARDVTNWVKANLHFNKSLEICKAKGDLIGQAESHQGLGYVLWRRGNFGGALKEYEAAINILEGATSRTDLRRLAVEKLAVIRIEEGNILGDKGSLEQALTSYKEALEVLTKLENRWEIARIHNNIGHLLVNLGNLDDALKEFEACSKIGHRLKDPRWMGWSDFNMAEVFGRKGDAAKSRALCEQARKHLTKIEDLVGLAKASYTMGYANMAEGKYDAAKKSFEESIKRIEQNDMPTLAAYYTYQYGLALLKMGDKEMALRQLKKALRTYKQVGADGYIARVQADIEKYSRHG
jgi:tetratricopeptide (TPR) repeat protein